MGDLSKHFLRSEFKCKCGKCDFDTVDYKLIILLEKIRCHFGKPVHINSGCRCKKYNRSIGSKDTSQHIKGKAADIRIDGITQDAIGQYADKLLGIDGCVIIYESFVHIDVRDGFYRGRH